MRSYTTDMGVCKHCTCPSMEKAKVESVLLSEQAIMKHSLTSNMRIVV